MNYTSLFHLRKKRLQSGVYSSSSFLAAGNKLINAVTIQGIPFSFLIDTNYTVTMNFKVLLM